MKKLIQAVLQRILGFRNYLFVFSLFKTRTILLDSKEGDFSLFLTYVQPESVVLDIGANIGIMTTHLSFKASQGRVIAFEPMPDNIAALQKIIRFNRLTNITLHTCALGNENKTTQMILPVVNRVKMQGLSHMIDKELTDFNVGITFEVPQYRLDDMEALKGLHIDAIKIDVENFEYQVFLGARHILSTYKPIVYCELWANENRSNCFQLMKELGYEISVREKDHLVPFDEHVHQTLNFFFVPRG